MPSGIAVESSRPYEPPKPEAAGTLMGMARERREQRREKREGGWSSFKNKVKEFGSKLADAMEVGRMVVTEEEARGVVGEMAKEKGQAVVGAARERGQAAVDRVNTKVTEKWEGAKTEWKRRETEFVRSIDESCNRVSEAIDQRVDSAVNRAAEIGKNTLNKYGREVAAPIIESILVPAVQTMDEAHRMVTDVEIGLREMIASPIESVTSKVMSVAESPDVKLIREMRERVRSNEGKRGLLGRLVERVGGWIESGVDKSGKLSLEAAQLREGARSIRERYMQSSQERAEMVQAAGRATEQLRQGIL